jgi:HAD superfamily hydrolase (TIGR01509 family)
MLKGLIFDMDDTLVNSTPLQKKTLARVLKRYNVNLYSIPSKLEKRILGKKIEEVIKTIINYYSLNITVKKLLKERDLYYLKALRNVKPMPGLGKLLRSLKSPKYKLALATNSRKEYKDIVFKRFHLNTIFDKVITCEDVVRGKPYPDIYLLALKKLKLKASEGIVFEDSTNGILAAKREGIKTVAVRNHLFNVKQDLSKADVIIDSLAEIPWLLDKL